MNDRTDSFDATDAGRAVQAITALADSGSVSDVPLRSGETLNQCLSCGRRIITAADETAPTISCRPGGDQTHQWVAVREQDNPAPLDPPAADISERWPIDAAAAREFLKDIGYQPPRDGWGAGEGRDDG